MQINRRQKSGPACGSPANKAQLSSRLNELDRRILSAQSSLEQLNLNELKEKVELSTKKLSATEAELTCKETEHDSVEAQLAAARGKKKKQKKTNVILTHNWHVLSQGDALSYLLAEPVNPSGTPVADQIKVSAGMEVAGNMPGH